MTEGAEEYESSHVRTDGRWGFTLKNPDDPRITGFGKWLRRSSLDEVPQLVNVLRGDMSIVGPRPLQPYEVALDGQLTSRLRMRPGMTGLWQVSGRHALPADDRAQLDLEYVHDWSLRLDIQILARTIPALFSKRGAY
jgi:exopolysaccharide production protein ExoY